MPNPYVVSLDREEVRYKTYYRRGSGTAQHHWTARPREGHRRVYVPRREESSRPSRSTGCRRSTSSSAGRAATGRRVAHGLGHPAHLAGRGRADPRLHRDAPRGWTRTTCGRSVLRLRRALAAGISAHHAGMLPVSETVEELFEAGLVKIVFATETLSLGINMPARSVVIEDLWKFQGERHEILAGRVHATDRPGGSSGIDDLGHAVVVYQRQVPFERVASLASTRTYELTSSFRPSYNMAVNLVRNYTREQAHHLLNSSFAQFLADRGVVTLDRELERSAEALEATVARCTASATSASTGGSVRRRRASARRRKGRERTRSDSVRAALSALRPGDVIFRPAGQTPRARGGPVGPREADGARAGPEVLPPVGARLRGRARRPDEGAAAQREVLAARDTAVTSRPAWRRSTCVRLGAPGEAWTRGPSARRPGSSGSRTTPATRAPTARRTSDGRRARATSNARSEASIAGSARGPRRSRASSSACSASLAELGYVERFTILPKGLVLAHLRRGRRPRSGGHRGRAPRGAVARRGRRARLHRRLRVPGARASSRRHAHREVAERYRRLQATWAHVRRAEDAHQVELCRELDGGFATPVFHWADGKPLDDVLRETTMAPGDFVPELQAAAGPAPPGRRRRPGGNRLDRTRGRGGREPRRRGVHRRLRSFALAPAGRIRAMPSPYGPLTVIVNPHAGKRRVGEEIPELERTLRARTFPTRCAGPRAGAMPAGSRGGARGEADSSWPWAATGRSTRS